MLNHLVLIPGADWFSFETKMSKRTEVGALELSMGLLPDSPKRSMGRHGLSDIPCLSLKAKINGIRLGLHHASRDGNIHPLE